MGSLIASRIASRSPCVLILGNVRQRESAGGEVTTCVCRESSV